MSVLSLCSVCLLGFSPASFRISDDRLQTHLHSVLGIFTAVFNFVIIIVVISCFLNATSSLAFVLLSMSVSLIIMSTIVVNLVAYQVFVLLVNIYSKEGSSMRQINEYFSYIQWNIRKNQHVLMLIILILLLSFRCLSLLTVIFISYHKQRLRSHSPYAEKSS